MGLTMHERLEEYLDALEREGCYRTEAVLKRSACEVTERVFFVGATGAEQGPFIRKRIERASGLGEAYGRIWEAQRAGRRFLHLPRLFECYETEEHLVVVMECVAGETLADVVFRCDPSLQLASEVFPSLCDAVTELHEGFAPPLIHRDLKPSNVMLSDAGLTVIDFGIARSFREGARNDTRHFGTQHYAPPEQFGFGQTDARSDVYALGMLLYYCLTEKTPDSGQGAKLFVDPAVPEALRPVLAQATAFDPTRRFPSAAVLKETFLQALQQIGSQDATPPDALGPSMQPGDVRSFVRTEHLDDRGLAAGLPSQRRWRPTVPRSLGVAWNLVLIAAWAIVVAAAAVCVAVPPQTMEGYPFWYVVVGYLGYIVPSASCIVFLLLDKRRLRQRFEWFARIGRKRELVMGLASLVLLFVAFGVVTMFAK